MGKLGDEDVLKKINDRKQNNADDSSQDYQQRVSRFIISPSNYWNMQWNNSTQIIFVAYIMIFPIIVSFD